MAGQMTRGLIAASKTLGWDPTVIPGFGSMTEFDRDAGRLGEWNPTLAKGVPAPDDSTYDNPGIGPDKVDFATPDVTRERSKHTTNANPFPGFDGGY